MDVPLRRTWPPARHAVRTVLVCAACASSTSSSSSSSTPTSRERRFSVLNRPPPNYPGHVPLTKTERVAMAVGSSAMALINPYRA
ncbi:hypothetical protein E4U54_007029, partial [Claviceps lovelessii]